LRDFGSFKLSFRGCACFSDVQMKKGALDAFGEAVKALELTWQMRRLLVKP
jgi:hypothetical protein